MSSTVSKMLRLLTNIKVEIKSKAMVKPFSPTPNHLKTLKLSVLDQFSPPMHVPFIFFYRSPTPITNSETATLLKRSLSETLVQFYPLAGRIEGNLSVKCNDEGVEYNEANVLASLDEILEDPNTEELKRLLPFAPLNNTNKTVVAGVQVNHFSCGGMALSVSLSHKVVDGATVSAFVNAWAAKARGETISETAPKFEFKSASMFPPIHLNGIYDPEFNICKEKIVTRRFIFDKEKIDALKKLAADGPKERDPTRIEVVSSYIWKQFIKAARTKPIPPKIVYAGQIVNLRARKSSPIPGNFCGNLAWPVLANAPVETETKYHKLVGKMRTAIKQLDASFIGKMIQTGGCISELQKDLVNLSQPQVDFCGFSSIVRFPLYEVDFGWGTPTWVSMTTLPFKNMVSLLSTKCGKGIEACVYVLEQDVAALEQDPEFLSLAAHKFQAN